MKKISLLFFICICFIKINSQTNIIKNSEFNNGLTNWEWFRNFDYDSIKIDTSYKLSGKNSCFIKLHNKRGTNWEQQFGQRIDLENTKVYRITFLGIADTTRLIQPMIQDQNGGYATPFSVNSILSKTKKKYSYLFYSNVTKTNYSITFMLGQSDTVRMWIDSVVISSFVRPTVTIKTPIDTAIYNLGDAVPFTVTAKDYDTITNVYYYENNTLLKNEVNYPYSTSITGLSLGTHKIYAKAMNRDSLVSRNDTVIIKIQNPIGIKEHTIFNNLNVFPNPSKDQLKINTIDNDNLNYIVLDINGNKIISGSINKISTIDISNLKNGMYMLQLITKEKIINHKFIKN